MSRKRIKRPREAWEEEGKKDLVILNASLTATGAVPTLSPLPKPPSVFVLDCVTKHHCLRKAGRLIYEGTARSLCKRLFFVAVVVV